MSYIGVPRSFKSIKIIAYNSREMGEYVYFNKNLSTIQQCWG